MVTDMPNEFKNVGSLLLKNRTVAENEHSKILSDLKIKGYAQLESLFNPHLVRRLRKLISVYYSQYQDKHGLAPSATNADLLYNLQNKDKEFIDIFSEPSLQRILMAKLNDPHFRYIPPGRPNYILNQFTARSSNDELSLHIDAGMPSSGSETMMMQAAFVLEPFRVESGCTWVAPKTHRSGEYAYQSINPSDLLPIEGNPGDVLLWDSRIWHSGGFNETGKTRWAIIATLSRWWVKPSFDMPRGLPEHIYQALNNEQKALIGYCSIPPLCDEERITRGQSYEQLKPRPQDFYSKDN